MMIPRVSYSTRGLRIEETYFDCPSDSSHHPGIDLIRLTELEGPALASIATPFSTRVIPLDASEEQLFAGLEGGARKEVRRALRDNVTTQVRNSDSLVTFLEFYDAFARRKGLANANTAKLTALARSGLLLLTCANAPDGAALVWHAYIRTETRARLLYSATTTERAESASDRQFVGRSNRLLHWFDIAHVHRLGPRELDLGGWYGGAADQALLRINDFKREFGGRVVNRYTCWRSASLKGACVLAALRIRHSVRNWKAAPQ